MVYDLSSLFKDSSKAIASNVHVHVYTCCTDLLPTAPVLLRAPSTSTYETQVL